MLGLFRSVRRNGGGDRPRTERGERVYAIGDVHGRLDLLRDLLAKVEEHADALPPASSSHVILLGDLVDRGPQSAEVLRLVNEVQRRTDRLIVLAGNHEELMSKSIEGIPGALSAWVRTGGRSTLRSLGVEPPEPDADPRAFAEFLRGALPSGWREWLRKLPLTARSGDYFFCHAGVRPGVSLARQSRDDLLWIRDDFLNDDSDHGAVIVHGHSITKEVEMRPNRIAIDTGAYRTGVLSALYLEGTNRAILSSAETG